MKNANTLKALVESRGLRWMSTTLINISMHFLIFGLHLLHSLCLVNVGGIIDLAGYLVLLRGFHKRLSEGVCRRASFPLHFKVNNILIKCDFTLLPPGVKPFEH